MVRCRAGGRSPGSLAATSDGVAWSKAQAEPESSTLTVNVFSDWSNGKPHWVLQSAASRARLMALLPR
jgi:hypothetical protein